MALAGLDAAATATATATATAGADGTAKLAQYRVRNIVALETAQTFLHLGILKKDDVFKTYAYEQLQSMRAALAAGGAASLLGYDGEALEGKRHAAVSAMECGTSVTSWRVICLFHPASHPPLSPGVLPISTEQLWKCFTNCGTSDRPPRRTTNWGRFTRATGRCG